MSRREGWPVAAWTVAGFLLRYALLPYRGEIGVDGAFFGMMAEKIATGEASFQLFRPPLFGYLTAALLPFFSGAEEAGRWVSLLTGTFSLPLIYLCGRLAVSHAAGLVALVLAAVEPSLLFHSTSVLSEPVYLFFFLAALLLTAALLGKKTALLAAAAGIGWGLAYLTRHEGGIYFFMTLAAILFFCAAKKSPLSKTVFLALFLVLGFGGAAFPYLNYLKKTTGQWTLSDKKDLQRYLGAASVGPGWKDRWEESALGLNRDGTEVVSLRFPLDPQIRREYLPTARESLRAYFYNAAHFLKTWSAAWLPFGLVLAMGAGLLAVLADPSLRRRAGWALFWVFPCAFAFFFYFDIRYFYFLIPLCLVLAGAGVEAVSKLFSAKKAVLWGTTLALAVSFLPATISAAKQSREEGDLSKEAGRWIRENYPLPTRVMDRYPQIPFYAGAEQVPLPFADEEKIFRYARFKGARLLVARKSVIARLRPQLLYLFDSPSPREGLKLVYSGRQRGADGEDEVRVFEFL